jgi:hypothetical protein
MIYYTGEFTVMSIAVSSLTVNAIKTGKMVFLEFNFSLNPPPNGVSYVSPFQVSDDIDGIVSSEEVIFEIFSTAEGETFEPFKICGTFANGMVIIPNYNYPTQNLIHVKGFKTYIIS